MSFKKLLEFLDNEDNITSLIDERKLKTLGYDLCTQINDDIESRGEWEEEQREWTKLALQVMETKTFPFPNASNIKYPLLTFAAMQFNARTYPALVPSNDIVKGKVIGYDSTGVKTDRAMRIGKHMSYQLMHKMDGWEEDQDRLLFILPLAGTCFKKTYYDPIIKAPVSDLVLGRDLVIDYYAKSVEKAERITHIMEYSENEIHEYVASGLWDRIKYQSTSSEEESRYNDPEFTHIDPPDSSYIPGPQIIYECHVIADLDGDGYSEPYIITIHRDTKQIVRIVPNFEEETITYDPETDEIISVRSINYFTKYGFIPNPESKIYDLGLGHLLGPINEGTNTLFNLLIDAGKLSNLQSGFLSRGLKIAGGNKPFRLGEWKIAQFTGDDMRKHIVPLPTKEPSGVLFSLLGMLVQAGEKLASTTEALSGQIPGQNVKATVYLQAIEQGSKIANSIHKRIYKSFEKELKKIFRLNRLYITDQEYFTILDDPNGQQAAIVSTDYSDKDMDISPTADPSVSNKELVLAKLQAAGDLVAQGLYNSQVYAREFAKAIELPNADEWMKLPPRGPSPEEQKMQFEQQKSQMEFQLEQMRLQNERIKVQSQAFKDQALAQKALVEAQATGDKMSIERADAQLRQIQAFNDALIRENEQALAAQEARMIESKPEEGSETEES